MLVVTKSVDVRAMILQGIEPSVVISLPKVSATDTSRAALSAGRTVTTGSWQICRSPCDGTPLCWGLDRVIGPDAVVRIPLFPYHVNEESASVLLQLGLQLGAAFALQQPAYASRLMLVFGEVFARDDGKPGYTTWVGAAFELGKDGVLDEY